MDFPRCAEAAGATIPSVARRLRWSAGLVQPDDADLVRGLRWAAWTGRPLGTDRFIERLEARHGRRLRAGPCGRPKK